jgi:hypothetical protein
MYVHFAPPCSTASHTRFIKRKFRSNPPVLHTDVHPDRLPNLPNEFQARVQAANHLYDLTQQLCQACHEHGVFSIENPARSFMWDATPMWLFIEEIHHYETCFYHCQFDSSRHKFTLLVHNIPTLLDLECRCDDFHPHELGNKHIWVRLPL